MVSLNIKVILRLRQSKRRVRLNKSLRQTNQTNSATDKGTRFTITTILIDVIFLVFNFPDALFDSYYLIIRYLISMSIHLGWFFDLCYHFAPVLSFSYSAALVLMFIIFNRIFRKELVIFFRLEKLIHIFSPNFSNSSSNRM